jgi:hypothetical protein
MEFKFEKLVIRKQYEFTFNLMNRLVAFKEKIKWA